MLGWQPENLAIKECVLAVAVFLGLRHCRQTPLHAMTNRQARRTCVMASTWNTQAIPNCEPCRTASRATVKNPWPQIGPITSLDAVFSRPKCLKQTPLRGIYRGELIMTSSSEGRLAHGHSPLTSRSQQRFGSAAMYGSGRMRTEITLKASRTPIFVDQAPI